MLGSNVRKPSMAILQTKKQSDLEKRLKLLRQQVYGKNSDTPTYRFSNSPSNPESSGTDVTYLYHDLSKIGIFASLTIGAQIILFILMKNHIVNLNLF